MGDFRNARPAGVRSWVLRPDGALLAATNGYGHMGEINEAIGEVFGSHSEGLYEVFGIDTDLIVDDVDAAVAYGLSFPPGESAFR